MRMRAAVLEEFGSPWSSQDLELDEPKGHEVLVRLVACGVCHTDLYTASGVDPSGYAPCVLGHEGAGVVEKVGADVTLVAPGDHVVTHFSPQCGECVHCRSPRTNLCLAIREQQNQGFLPDGTTRLSRDGERIRHFMGTSTFAEYTVMPEIALSKVNPEAPLEGAALFACGLSTGLGAAMQTAKVEEGSTCVVFGAGLVGLGAVAGCRLQGAERIIAVDLSEDRLELARGQGATDVRSPASDTVDWILEQTGGFGADYTFEATGNVKVMRQAVESARMGWGLCTVAGVAGKGETLDVIPRLLITGRRVAGSSFGGLKSRDQVPPLIDRWLAGEIDVAAVALAPAHARRGQQGLRADGGTGRDPLGDLASEYVCERRHGTHRTPHRRRRLPRPQRRHPRRRAQGHQRLRPRVRRLPLRLGGRARRRRDGPHARDHARHPAPRRHDPRHLAHERLQGGERRSSACRPRSRSCGSTR